MISSQQIKELRERTGAGISDVKKALEDAKGDVARAHDLIQRKFGGVAEKKASRETRAGLVDAYIHSNGKIGVLVEISCETDFVARNPAFKELAHDIAMHIAAMRPLYMSLDTVPKDVWQIEKERFEEEVRALGKPAAITGQIVDGKLKAHFGALALLEQPFIKDQDKSVGEMIKEAIGKFGENMKVGRFTRLEI
ncbi:MAG: elongation factor T [Parcubacteria group bacterium Gr01-1014_33]|nr:MAG: elongation factor T [Parcubacteria group bacterium Gr01-1014_33]